MNKVLLCGWVNREPVIRDGSETKVARFTLSVRKQYQREGEQRKSDYPSCVAFGKNAEFVEKYLHDGTKMIVEGHLQTGNYTDKDGVKRYTTDVIVDSMEFADSKNGSGNSSGNKQRKEESKNEDDDFMNVPPNMDSELPFE